MRASFWSRAGDELGVNDGTAIHLVRVDLQVRYSKWTYLWWIGIFVAREGLLSVGVRCQSERAFFQWRSAPF